jgi:hypothetical protein
MQAATEEYKGFRITVTPIKDKDDLWDYEYALTRINGGAPAPSPETRRARTAGGHLDPEAAIAAGIEMAKTEVDNLVWLASPVA